jgi:hypothetical protein
MTNEKFIVCLGKNWHRPTAGVDPYDPIRLSLESIATAAFPVIYLANDSYRTRIKEKLIFSTGVTEQGMSESRAMQEQFFNLADRMGLQNNQIPKNLIENESRTTIQNINQVKAIITEEGFDPLKVDITVATVGFHIRRSTMLMRQKFGNQWLDPFGNYGKLLNQDYTPVSERVKHIDTWQSYLNALKDNGKPKLRKILFDHFKDYYSEFFKQGIFPELISANDLVLYLERHLEKNIEREHMVESIGSIPIVRKVLDKVVTMALRQ